LRLLSREATLQEGSFLASFVNEIPDEALIEEE
jgi:hypothetical protein